MIDFARAWQITKSVDIDCHHIECSFRVTRGEILCDCQVITDHAEMVDRDNM